MKMVAHQTPRDNNDMLLRKNLLELLQQEKPVIIVLENQLATIATSDCVIVARFRHFARVCCHNAFPSVNCI